MPFQIIALPAEPFAPLFAMSDEQLTERAAARRIADCTPGFPCRVSLQDAALGERLILTNFTHQPAASPYQASHAIFVREGALQAQPAPDTVPQMLQTRLLSVRAFDAHGMMLDAEVVDGAELEGLLETMLTEPAAAYLHIHFAKPGCYAAQVIRG